MVWTSSDIDEVVAWVHTASLLDEAVETIANETLCGDTDTGTEVVPIETEFVVDMCAHLDRIEVGEEIWDDKVADFDK